MATEIIKLNVLDPGFNQNLYSLSTNSSTSLCFICREEIDASLEINVC